MTMNESQQTMGHLKHVLLFLTLLVDISSQFFSRPRMNYGAHIFKTASLCCEEFSSSRLVIFKPPRIFLCLYLRFNSWSCLTFLESFTFLIRIDLADISTTARHVGQNKQKTHTIRDVIRVSAI